jgi:hypothetical protein
MVCCHTCMIHNVLHSTGRNHTRRLVIRINFFRTGQSYVYKSKVIFLPLLVTRSEPGKRPTLLITLYAYDSYEYDWRACKIHVGLIS